MEINNKEISSIEVLYHTDSKIIEVKSFSPDIKFHDIIDYFNSNIKNINPILQLRKDYYYQKAKIDGSVNILELLKENSNSENGKLNIYIEIIDTQDNNRLSYILKPKNNPFGIIAFSVNSKEILTKDFEKELIDANNLDKYNPEYSAYCNANNTLFISGGQEKKNDLLDNFWIINYNFNEEKNSYEIKNKKMPSGKKEHSMIYNKLIDSIYIIGGNDKKCFIYDIKNDKFSEMPELNEICSKPGLFIKNNYLYVFDSFERKKKFFQKLNLDKMDKFENFTPKNYSLNNNKFYGVCESNNDNNIIFCGGDRTGAYTIIYEISKDDLIKSKGKDINCKLNDKTFYKINQNYSINIPESKDPKEKSIIALDLRTNDAFKIMFDNEGKTTFKFDKNEENDITLEPLIENKKLSQSLNIPFSIEGNDKKIKDNEIIISQSTNNENKLDINNGEIKLKTNNQKRNLQEIKTDSENKEIEDKNIKQENEIENIEIKVEQEVKDKDGVEKLYKFRQPPKLSSTSGPTVNTRYNNTSIDKEEEKNKENNLNEEKTENKNNIEENVEINNLEENNNKNIENLNNKNGNKEEEMNNIDKVILKRINKTKNPKNLKLFQSNIFFNNYLKLNISKENDLNKKVNQPLNKSVYLYDDSSLYNKYNNYLYHEIIPDFKQKDNRVKSTPNLEIKLKNPISKSKVIKKEEINGTSYSFICEKIIDKSNLPLYQSFNMKNNNTIENEFDNHRLFISQYNIMDSNEIYE